MNRSISVVIPNYNGKDLLEENLPPLYNALQLAGVEYEIIIPDDCSTDDSISFLRQQYPDIIIIENAVNKGFSPNINTGIVVASKELVFIMNSDVKLRGDYFTAQLPYFDRADTFGVQGRIIGYDNDLIQDAAKTQHRTGLKIGAASNIIPVSEDYALFPTLYLSGANALVNRVKLMELGGFDEVYAPFYGEDLDLCMRAWKLGWKSYYHHASVCRHPNSVTIQKYNKKRKIKIIVYRNRFIMHAIHLNGIDLLRWNSWVILQLIVKTLVGKTEFLEGYKQYSSMSDRVQQSKKHLKDLGIKYGCLLTNNQVYEQLFRAQRSVLHKIVR